MSNRLVPLALFAFCVTACAPTTSGPAPTTAVVIETLVIAPRFSPTSSASSTRTATVVTATPSSTGTPLPPTTAPTPTTRPAPLPTATPFPTPTVTRVMPTATATSSIIYGAPVLFDPPDGRLLSARNTILRWRSDHLLNPDESFDVLVWPDYLSEPARLATTRETIIPIDLVRWKYGNGTARFLWTVRVVRSDGMVLSSASQPYSFTLLGQ